MAWVSVDKNGTEAIFTNKPERFIYETDWPDDEWYDRHGMYVNLPSGSIEKLIERKLTWEDEPVELTSAGIFSCGLRSTKLSKY